MRHWLVSSLLALSATPTMAIINGTTPIDGQVINPFTGQELRVWKLAGKYVYPTGVCGAVLIHPQWTLGVAHCSAGGGMPFNSNLSPAGVLTDFCVIHPGYVSELQSAGTTSDYSLCRLKTRIDTYGTLPPLVAAPSEIMPANAPTNVLRDFAVRAQLRPQLAKWGYLLGYGFSPSGPGMSITDFSGTPLGLDPARNRSSATEFTWTAGGDSGGAVFWISPTNAEPALVGVLGVQGTVASSPNYLTPTVINWVTQTLSGYGDTDLRVITTSQHFSGPSGNAVQELNAAPRIRSVQNSRSNFSVL